MTLLFVRHGESEGNTRRIMQGWLDTELSETGVRQAEAVARRLASAGASRLYSSSLLRAHQSADRIGAATGLPVEPLDDMREYNLGEGQGLTWDEVVARFGISDANWGTGLIPGEEGILAFYDRLALVVDRLTERHRDDTAIVVSHGGAIARVVVHVLGAPRDAYLRFGTPANASITAVTRDRGRHVLASLNDVCHLSEVVV